MTLLTRTRLTLLLVPLFLGTACAQDAPTNLLANGGGEAADAAKLGDNEGSPFHELLGWTMAEGSFVAQRAGWYDITAPGGDWFLRPSEVAYAEAYQDVTLPAEGPRGFAVLRGWLRSWAGDDTPQLALRALAADGAVLAETTGDPVTDVAWADAPVVLEVPEGTATLRAVLMGTRRAGGHNDSYFDDVRLYLTDAEPLFARAAAPALGELPGQVRFEDRSLGTVESRVWDFGDGTTSDEADPVHRYGAPGDYTVRLTVLGAAGDEDTLTLATPGTGPEFAIVKGPYLQNVTPTGMTVMWETNYAAASTLQIGDDRPVTDGAPKTIHQMRVEGLTPGERVPYRVQSASGGETVEASSSLKAAPDGRAPFTFCVWGDSQDQPEVFSKLVEGMATHQPDLLVSVGDITSNGLNYHEWDNRFFEPLRPLIDEAPVYVAIGNHERDSDWFYKFMDQPGNEHWFSFQYGGSHFTILDTNYPFAPGAPQYEWFLKDIQSDAAQQADWRFVFHHHPPFSEIYEEDIYKHIRERLVPLYMAHGVDMVFNGHVHVYERGNLDRPDGGVIWFIQTSGGGGRLWEDEYDGEWDAIDKVIQFRYHYCALEVDGRSLSFRALDLDGEEMDRFNAEAKPRR